MPICHSVSKGSVIFAGKVLQAPEPDSRGERAVQPALLEVSEGFVGLEDGEHEVRVWAAWLEQGQEYLIVGYRTDAGDVSLGICSPTNQLSRTDNEDLLYLRNLSERKPSATLEGFVSDRKEGFLPGVRVTARSGEHEAVTETDQNGRYGFKDLPPGVYDVTVEKDGYVRREHRDRHVNLAHGSCAYLPFDLHINGVISGTVLAPDGSPAKGYEVQMVSRASGVIERYVDQTARTDEQGRFELIGVHPGEYVIGINILRHDRASPIVKTFYPGTSDPSRSLPIVIGRGQRHEAGSFWVPAPIASERVVEVEVVWPDGAPIDMGVVTGEVLSEDGEALYQIHEEFGPNGKAPAVRVFVGLRQRFRAWVYQAEWRGNRCLTCVSGDVEVDLADAPSKLRFVVDQSVAPKRALVAK